MCARATKWLVVWMLCLLIAPSANAAVVANLSGSLSWQFDNWTPSTIAPWNNLGRMYYAIGYVYTYASGPGFGPNGQAYVDQSPYEWLGSTLSGTTDAAGGHAFAMTAVSPFPGSARMNVYSNMGGAMQYVTPPGVSALPGFSYTYDFDGVSTGPYIQAIIQMEVVCYVRVGEDWVQETLYSNYAPGEPYHDPNFPKFDVNGYGNILDESGTRTFGPFTTSLDTSAGALWRIGYDFGNGVETLIPEPATLSLLALGGLALLRRRRAA